MKSCTFFSTISSLKRKSTSSTSTTRKKRPIRFGRSGGLVTICEGTRVDYSAVTAWYCQMRDELKIDAFKIGYDRALAGYWVDEMKANGFEMCAVAQGPLHGRNL